MKTGLQYAVSGMLYHHNSGTDFDLIRILTHTAWFL